MKGSNQPNNPLAIPLIMQRVSPLLTERHPCLCTPQQETSRAWANPIPNIVGNRKNTVEKLELLLKNVPVPTLPQADIHLTIYTDS